jgi:hypothetical protein
MQLNFQKVKVTDTHGESADADLFQCSECECNLFYVYIVHVNSTNHLHFQCFHCKVSYCDGSCSQGETGDMGSSPSYVQG